jgi:hypothetical protein
MPDTVIARVNALGTDQPKQLIFTDRRGRLIGDVEIPGVVDFEEEDDDDAVMPVLDPVGVNGVEIPGVDVAGQAPQTVEIDDLNIPQPDPPFEKRDGSLKGRTVAGGNKQQGYISKEDASSPTIATEAILLSCIIDAEEGRDVAVINIPNAFIQTRVEDEGDMAIIKIRGVLVDILVEIAPDVYKSYVTTDKKGTKQLLVQCQNALYGTMVASLLYYRKFTKSLTSVGFNINPYDPCVANKTVDGTQMTICFHADDCKLSHHSSRANNNIIDWLRQEYESIFEDGSGKMTVSRGRVHKYLGMTSDYTVRGRVNISMFDYVDEIINVFDNAEPKGGSTKSSAAPDNLFKVDKDCEKLPPEKAIEFHNLVAKTLYATK